MNKLISIIIPVYNVEKYLAKCLDSVVRQTVNNFDIIIVNDKSSDNSERIIINYKEKYNNIIYVKNKENLGLGGARNEGLRYCTTNYVLFLDSDDWLELNTIELLNKEIVDESADIYVYGMYKYFAKSNKRKIMYGPSLKTFNNKRDIITSFFNSKYNPFLISACNKLYKTELFNVKDNLFPSHLYYEDLATTYKILISSNKIKITNNILYNYLLREDSITKVATQKHISDIIYISAQLQNYFENNYQAYKKIVQEFIFYKITIQLIDKIILYNKDVDENFVLLQKKIHTLHFNELGKKELVFLEKIKSINKISVIKSDVIFFLASRKTSLKQKIITIIYRNILYKFPSIYKNYIS